MSHFAQVIDGKVVQVLVAEQEFIDEYSKTTEGEWIQTSYNTHGGIHYDPHTGQPSADQTKALRKNYAGLGYIYDLSLDAFYEPQPYPSWTLDEQTCLWQPPVPYPSDGGIYAWDEASLSWVSRIPEEPEA